MSKDKKESKLGVETKQAVINCGFVRTFVEFLFNDVDILAGEN